MERRRRLEEKLRERRDRERLGELESQLEGLLTGRSLTEGQTPDWAVTAIRHFWRTATAPADRLPDDAAPEQVAAWAAGLLAAHGVTGGGTVWLASGTQSHPWLECSTREADWLERVRAALPRTQLLLSADRERVAAVTEEEYTFAFHTAARGDAV